MTIRTSSKLSRFTISFVIGFSALAAQNVTADPPTYMAECSPQNAAGKIMSLNFDRKESSVFEPKEIEPIWMDYNDDLGEFTTCQQKSQYVSQFLNSLITLVKKPGFKGSSLSLGKMKIDPLSSPFVCVKFSKKGYEYVGAFVFDHENNHFPSPNENKYGLLFLPLTGKASDGNLGKPTILTYSETIRGIESPVESLEKQVLKRGKGKGAVKKRSFRAKTSTITYAKLFAYECRSMGRRTSEPDLEVSPGLIDEEVPFDSPVGAPLGNAPSENAPVDAPLDAPFEGDSDFDDSELAE